MTDRNGHNERSSERRPAEGVRIIGAEEAQKALEAGQVAGRRPDDELRYGDVPPAPSGPRPPHRFPLPDSVDPAEAVPRPPVAPLRGESPQAHRRTRPAEPTAPEAVPEPAAAPVDDYSYADEEAADGDGWADAEPEDVDPVPAWQDPAAPAWRDDVRAGFDEIEPTGPLPVLGADPSAAWDEGRPAATGLRWAPDVAPATGAPTVATPTGYPAATSDEPAGGAFDTAAPPYEPSAYEPRSYEPSAYEPRADEPVSDQSGPYEPGAYEPGAYEPAAYEPAAYEPAAYEPAAYEPGSYRPSTGTDEGAYDGPYDPVTADPDVHGTATYAPGTFDSIADEPPVQGPSPSAAPRSSSWNLGERSSPWDPRTGDPAPGGVTPAEDEDSWDTAATWAPGRTAADGWQDEPGDGAPSWRGGEDAVPDLAPPEEGITVTGSHELPHWTEPSEGVPASLAGPGREDDADAWNALGEGGARWRHEGDDWDDDVDPSGGFFADEDDQGPRLGVLDTDRSDHSDLYSFDEAFQQLEEERSGAHPAISVDDPEEDPLLDPAVAAAPTRTGTRRRPARPRSSPRPVRSQRAPRATERPAPPRRSGTRPPSGGQELGSRLLVGAGLVVLLVIAYLIGPKALVVLAAAVVLLCAAEAYGVLQRCGFRPATLLGLTATGGLMFAAYWRGEPAVPLVVALAFAGTMIWYLLGIVEARPLANVAVTSMTVVWIGVLGSFAALMLRVPHGKGLFLGAVVVTVASDVVAYFAGRQFGHRALAPGISPGKTVEGLVAGSVGAIVVGLIIGHAVSPWGGLKHGLLLGVVVAVFAPIGDLFESLIKRDLDVKDSGTALAGHGGLLDRFDSLLLVLPAVYYAADYLHLVR